ncbi:MAG: ATP-binding protein [Pseudomonadota bacterium]|nr:ATP-binding protein [Pseudomonadota bacterium]
MVRSLQARLSLSVSVAILCVAVIAGAFSFYAAFDEAHELQDDVLRQVAALSVRHHSDAAALTQARSAPGTDRSSTVYVQELGTAPAQGGSGAALQLALPPTLAPGWHTVVLEGERFRVLVTALDGARRLAVAQETEVRDEIARDSALRTLAPFLILVPLLLGLIADLIRRVMQPIATLAEEIDRRGDAALHPLSDTSLPAEIRPFVTSINRLLERVGQALGQQRRFVADAAHALRSPMTALSLQAERLAGLSMPPEVADQVNAMQRGIERNRNLLDQLLAMARAETPERFVRSEVDLSDLFRNVIEHAWPLAQARQIDLGVVGAHDARVLVSEIDLSTLLTNLVDNAIRYTPPGGKVDLSIATGSDRVVLVVEDNGPGIAPQEHVRVFDAFYRLPETEQAGSGLGLAIVRALSHRLGAQLALSYTDPILQRGLRVSVTLPRQ